MKDLNVVNEVRIGNTLKAVKGLYGYFTVVKKHVLSNNGTLQDAEVIFQGAVNLVLEI